MSVLRCTVRIEGDNASILNAEGIGHEAFTIKEADELRAMLVSTFENYDEGNSPLSRLINLLHALTNDTDAFILTCIPDQTGSK